MECTEDKRKNVKIKELFFKSSKMKMLTAYIMLNIAFVTISSYLVTVKVINYKHIGRGFVALLVVNIIVALVIIIKKYYKKNIVHIFMGLIILCGVISTIFAIKPQVALWGIGGRYEGLFSIMYYFSLMFLSGFVGKKYKKIIAVTIVVTGIIQCIYAICQIYEVEGVYRMIHSSNKIQFRADGFYIEKTVWATGFTTNPNFFGTYMMLCTTLALGLFIDEKKIIKAIIYAVMSLFLIIGIMISNTMSSVVGLGAVLIFALVYCIVNKKFIKVIFYAVAIICMILFVYKSGKTTLLKDMKIVGDQSAEIANGNIQENYGTNRFYIWKNTMKIIPQNLVHGVGIDNFYYAFNGKALVSKDGRTFYDKVHNEYLQVLITEGVCCLFAYVLMYAVIGIRGTVHAYRNKEIFCILPVIGYMVQAFFNISVIEVAPMFYILLGMCMNPGNKRIEQKQ